MDKRNEERISKELKVIFGECGFEGFCTTANLSRNGMFVYTDEIFPPNSEVEIILDGPEDLIYLTGEVRWTTDYSPEIYENPGMGIKIKEAPNEYVIFIKSYS